MRAPTAKASIDGWCSIGSEVRLELWQYDGMSYKKNVPVKVRPVVDLCTTSRQNIIFLCAVQCRWGGIARDTLSARRDSTRSSYHGIERDTLDGIEISRSLTREGIYGNLETQDSTGRDNIDIMGFHGTGFNGYRKERYSTGRY